MGGSVLDLAIAVRYHRAPKHMQLVIIPIMTPTAMHPSATQTLACAGLTPTLHQPLVGTNTPPRPTSRHQSDVPTAQLPPPLMPHRALRPHDTPDPAPNPLGCLGTFSHRASPNPGTPPATQSAAGPRILWAAIAKPSRPYNPATPLASPWDSLRTGMVKPQERPQGPGRGAGWLAITHHSRTAQPFEVVAWQHTHASEHAAGCGVWHAHGWAASVPHCAVPAVRQVGSEVSKFGGWVHMGAYRCEK